MGNNSGKIVSYSGLVFLPLFKSYQTQGGTSVDFVTIDQHGCVTLFVYNTSDIQPSSDKGTEKLISDFSRLSFQDIRKMCETYYHLRFEFVFEEKFDRVPSLVRPFNLDKIRVITFVSKETQLNAVNLDLYISGPTNALIFEYIKNSYQLNNWIIEEASSPVKVKKESPNETDDQFPDNNNIINSDNKLFPSVEIENKEGGISKKDEAVEKTESVNQKSFALEEDFAVGIPAMDQQHKVFFDIYKQISELPTDEKSFDQLVYSINKLKYYIRTHFRSEEELMRKAGFEGLENHISEHEMFVEKIDSFSFGLEYKNPQLANQLLLFIRKWLLTHVSKTDMQYVECVKAYLNERSA